MDALSEALNAVRVTGAIFYNAEFTAPWGFRAGTAQQIARALAPGTECVVPYHLVLEGEALARIEGSAGSVSLQAGDIVVVPHGAAHTLSNGSPRELLDGGSLLDQVVAGDLRTTEVGGGGAPTRFVCGFFGCERHAGRLFLAGLPQALRINVRGHESGAWIESSIRYLVYDAGSPRPGRTALLAKMAEALFIETLRRYMEQLPKEQTGWLAGARDPVVGSVLALLHRKPAQPWTLAELAAAAGASRSVIAERFHHFVGESPMTYLARWRMQLAARLLETTRRTIVEIAGEVGYESEAAFNRAFRREFGVPPGSYRRKRSGEPAARARG